MPRNRSRIRVARCRPARRRRDRRPRQHAAAGGCPRPLDQHREAMAGKSRTQGTPRGAQAREPEAKRGSRAENERRTIRRYRPARSARALAGTQGRRRGSRRRLAAIAPSVTGSRRRALAPFRSMRATVHAASDASALRPRTRPDRGARSRARSLMTSRPFDGSRCRLVPLVFQPLALVAHEIVRARRAARCRCLPPRPRDSRGRDRGRSGTARQHAVQAARSSFVVSSSCRSSAAV